MSSRSPVSRRKTEGRAFSLLVAGGGLGIVGVVGVLLSIFGIVGFGIPFLCLVLAAVCGLLFRRTVS
jgi:hypothetical protein